MVRAASGSGEPEDPMIATLALTTAATLVVLLAALPLRRLVWAGRSSRTADLIDRYVPLVTVLVVLAGAVAGFVLLYRA